MPAKLTTEDCVLLLRLIRAKCTKLEWDYSALGVNTGERSNWSSEAAYQEFIKLVDLDARIASAVLGD